MFYQDNTGSSRHDVNCTIEVYIFFTSLHKVKTPVATFHKLIPGQGGCSPTQGLNQNFWKWVHDEMQVWVNKHFKSDSQIQTFEKARLDCSEVTTLPSSARRLSSRRTEVMELSSVWIWALHPPPHLQSFSFSPPHHYFPTLVLSVPGRLCWFWTAGLILSGLM